MPNTLNVESDPFLVLLTDALRAGPGSPEWHQAVTKLRGAGVAGADEYTLLCTAREHLASGRDFRAVRAGPDFTRRLLTQLEDESPGGGTRLNVPTANLVIIVSAL